MSEQTDVELEQSFKNSWVGMQIFYADIIIIQERSFVIPIYRTVMILRHTGYDRKLRAGQSLDSLILSRSRLHGLRPDQPALQIFVEEDKFTVNYFDGQSKQTMMVDATDKNLIIADELLQLINQLVEQPLS